MLIKFKDVSIGRCTDSHMMLHRLFVTLFHRSVDLVTVNSSFDPDFIGKVMQTKRLLDEAEIRTWLRDITDSIYSLEKDLRPGRDFQN